MNGTKPTPYVGTRPFKTDEGDRFFGRDRESLDLLSLVISERLVLFYAQSGAGKSSLINAKLIPGLVREREFKLLPVGRVGGSEAAVDVDNIYVYHLINSLLRQAALQENQASPTLTEFLKGLETERDSDLKTVLIIDQFEELFSTHQEAWEKREDFFRQLAQAMQEIPHLWVVLVMREDFIAYLDPYVYLLPGKLRVRYYMQRLERDGALQAIKKPVEKLRPYAEGVAEKLVENLAGIKVQKPNGEMETRLGQFVESVQLQVVCQNLWEHLSPGGTEITQNDLDSVGDVDEALERYYDERLSTVASENHIPEREIRDWFEKELITSSRTRNMVLRGKNASEGLDNDVIRDLQGNLIRSEVRAGQIWYELSHDRLIEPVLKSNAKWFASNLNFFQQQAALWNERGRSEGLLLRRTELRGAEAWAEANTDQLTEAEELFLKACREARQDAKEKAMANRRLRSALRTASLVAGIASLLFLTSIALGFQSYQNQRTIEMQALINASSAELQKGKIDSAAVLAYQALIGYGHDHGEPEEALANITHPMDARVSVQAPFIISNTVIGVNSISFNPADGGQSVAAGYSDGNIYVVDVAKRQLIGQPFIEHTSPVTSVAFSPDGRTLASGSYDSTTILWDVATGQQIGEPLTGHTGQITSVAFSPDGKILASGSYDYSVILWDVASGQPIGQPLIGHTDWVNAIAFSPDGKILASGGDIYDKNIVLWDVAKRQQIGQPLTGHTDRVSSVAFSPDGKILASGGGYDGSIRLWDVQTHQPIGEPLKGQSTQVASVAFSPDGRTLASGTGDGASIVLWDVLARQTVSELRTSQTSQVSSIAFSPDGRTLASAAFSETDIILWDVQTGQTIGEPIMGLISTDITTVNAMNLTSDADVLAQVGNELIVWDFESGQRTTGEVARDLDDEYLLESTAYSGPYAISLDGNFRVEGINNSVIISEVATSNVVARRWHGGATVTAVAFSRDGEYVASAGDNKTVQIWDAHNGTRIARIDFEDEAPGSMAFSPDGTRIALAYGETVYNSGTGTVEVWDIKSRQSVLRIEDGQLQSLRYTVLSTNQFAGNQDSQSGTGSDVNQQAGNPVADILYSSEGLFILYHNGVVDRWDIWPSRAELIKSAEQICQACELTYEQREDFELYTWPMQITNIAGYLFAAVGLVGFLILNRLAYSALFARTDKPSETQGFSWKKLLIASAQGAVLISLSFLSWVFLNFSEMIFHDPFEVQGPEQTILWQLLLTLPLGLWAGGVYSHLTPQQTGKRSRTKRALIGMLAGALAGTLATFLGISALSYATTRDFSLISDGTWVVLVLIGTGAGALMSLLGALIYIFWLHPWSQRRRVQQEQEEDF